MAQKILVYDIETTSTNVNEAEFRLFGFKTSEEEGFFYTSNINEVKRIIDDHDVLVGYNNIEYDNKILEKYGISFYGKIVVDLMQILHGKGFGADLGRKRIIVLPNGKNLGAILHRKSLDAASEAMGGPRKIGDFDYTLFKKPFYELTSQQQQIAIEYLKRDIDMTEHIYIFLEEYFKDFKKGGVEIDGVWKPFMTPEQVRKKQYLTSSVAAFVYKAICNLANIEERYGDAQREDYGGGYVALPSCDYEKGDIYCLDFNSLYPTVMIQANLYGKADPFSNRKTWKGEGISETHGTYYADSLAPVSKVLQQLYLKRLEYKKNKDERQYTVKILINCFSEDSEILTKNGIKKIKDCEIGEEVLSINPQTGETEYNPIIAKTIQDYSGPMYHLRDGNKDLLVTPNHDVLYQFKSSDTIYKCHAEDMSKYSVRHFPKTKPKSGKICDTFDTSRFIKSGYIVTDKYIQGRKRDMKLLRQLPTNELFYFFGTYLSEGNLRIISPKKFKNTTRGTTYIVSIAKYESEHKKKIIKILDKLKFRYKVYKKNIVICSKILYDILLENFGNGAYNKYIPEWIFEYDYTHLQYLYDGMYDGDGNKMQNRYSTVSKKLRDGYIRLSLHLGKRSRYYYDSNCWRIVNVPHGNYKRKNWKVVKNLTDKVVCVTVADNHTIFAGRNGYFHWTGQTIYGLLGNPSFSSVSNFTAAADCTRLGRQWIKYARKKFREAGYKVLYTDTDSVYLKDVFKDKERMLKVKDEIIEDIKTTVPFPQDTFDMSIDDEIDFIAFFRAPGGNEFLKKNYLYVTTNGKLKIKGLQIIKSNASPLGKLIFDKYIKPEILKNFRYKFKKSMMEEWIYKELKNNISLASVTFKVNKPETYAVPTQIQAQIAQKFGEGSYNLIKLKGEHRHGVGVSKNYVRVEDLGNISLSMIDITKTLRELEPFIDSSQTTLVTFLK